MSNLFLNHQHTPPELQTINAQLEAMLASESMDEAQLLQIVEQRDDLVTVLLKSLKDDELKAFAELEVETNQRLVSHIRTLLSASLTQASSLVRGLKAIKNYQT